MKKTLVAVAAMAAVTGAMAEVTISGQLDQAYNTVRTTTAGQVSSTRTTLSNNALGQDALNFGVTEDVGGGITAYGNVNTIFNATTAAGSALTVDNGSGIGVRGEFGDIRLGVSYADTFFTSAASDASGWGAGTAVGQVHGVGTVGAALNTVQYTLPQFISGLKINLQRHVGETAGTRNGESQGGSVAYTTGGLSLGYAILNGKNTGAATDWTTRPGVGDQAAVQEAATAGSTSRANAFSASYDFQVAKLWVGYNTLASGGNTNQTATSSTYGISAPFGAVSVGIAASNASYKSAANASITATGTKLLTSYAFSKRTSAYFQYGVAKLSGNNGSATGNGIGLWHRF